MNITNYISGELRQEYQYKSFVPSMINHTFTWDDPQFNTLLEDATRAIAKEERLEHIFTIYKQMTYQGTK